MGSRKLFAIDPHLKRAKKTKRTRPNSDSDDGMNFCQWDDIGCRLDLIESKISKILDVGPHVPIPIGLLAIIKETFKCQICLGIISPPAIFGRCCRQMIGCRSCIDEWYKGEEGLTRQCPLCRGERGFADTAPILGMDQFLTQVWGALGSSANEVPPSPQRPREVPPAPQSLPNFEDDST